MMTGAVRPSSLFYTPAAHPRRPFELVPRTAPKAELLRFDDPFSDHVTNELRA